MLASSLHLGHAWGSPKWSIGERFVPRRFADRPPWWYGRGSQSEQMFTDIVSFSLEPTQRTRPAVSLSRRFRWNSWLLCAMYLQCETEYLVRVSSATQMHRRWNRSIVLYCWMRRMRPHTVQIDRQEGHPMEEKDKGEERTITIGDVYTQPATPVRPYVCLHLPNHLLPKMRSLHLDDTLGRRRGTTRHALPTGWEVCQLVLVLIVVREPSVSGPVGDSASVIKPTCCIRSTIKSRR